MASGTPVRTGPAYISNSAANILNPSANTYQMIRKITVVNKDSSQRTFSLYIGATGGSAGGTEIAKDVPVAVGSYVTLPYTVTKLSSSDFLTGIASAASALVITVDSEAFAA